MQALRWRGRTSLRGSRTAHPGRAGVGVVFNALIALLLMELNLFQALGKVLGLYSNIAIAWMVAVVADLVVNKPMGWCTQGHRVQARLSVRHQPRGRGCDGPGVVGVGDGVRGMAGRAGPGLSAVLAMVVAFTTSPLIAWATRAANPWRRTPEPAIAPEGTSMLREDFWGADGVGAASRRWVASP